MKRAVGAPAHSLALCAVEDAAALIRRGTQNRRIGQTKMNHESSRSHSVLTCTIESTLRSSVGVTNIRFSRLNLIDLAGQRTPQPMARHVSVWHGMPRDKRCQPASTGWTQDPGAILTNVHRDRAPDEACHTHSPCLVCVSVQ